MFKLKKNVAQFDVVDGALAGKKFRRGEIYAEIPKGCENKFEPARAASAAPADISTKAPEGNENASRRGGRRGGKK